MKKRKIRTKTTPEQQVRIFKITALFVIIALLWIIFSPTTGLYGLLKQKSKLERLQEKTVELQEENRLLQEELDRLQNDKEYLEKLARKQGLMKKNERVYDFSEESSK